MRRRPSSSVLVAEWSPALRGLLLAAQRECPPGHAEALRELTALALVKVPSRGIFDPTTRGEHELFGAIDAIAEAHLELGDARAAWRTALRRSGLALPARDDVEGAAQQVQGVYDTAYYYTGLAFGLAWVAGSRVG